MPRAQIQKIGDSLAVLLTEDMLQSMRLGADDEVEITVENRMLVITPLDKQEQREQRIDNAVQSIFRRRASAYQQLAEGA